MRVLEYSEIDISGVREQYHKVKDFLIKQDFKAAQVKKLSNTAYYRAKLDDKNRLLFKFVYYQGERCLLLLEVIYQHAYEKSRFLYGHSQLQEEDFIPVDDTNESADDTIIYLHVNSKKVHFLNKILSFDEIQESIFSLSPPLIIVGSAGSGKTVLTLEKLKQLPGQVLYVTQSPYLTENARALYYAENYHNDSQEIDFYHYQELLETLRIPMGKPLSFAAFSGWLQKQPSKLTKDRNKLYEEFKGVLTGSLTDAAYLSRERYLALGVKQSIFQVEERALVYDLFERYCAWLTLQDYYDVNMLSFSYLALIKPKYDFVVIDEVQDLTNIQIKLILQSLYQPTQFVLCGDANQIVHPNFFSWSKVKTLFYESAESSPKEITRVLSRNYRNSRAVNDLANNVLKLKNIRFGSVDKESHYLMETYSEREGQIQCVKLQDKIVDDLNRKTHFSRHTAVLVLNDEHKVQAKIYFQTPLIFSIHEAKGLEYETVIIFNMIHAENKRFCDIAKSITPEDLQKPIEYGRAKDKSDKSLEIYKFYINALYVATTRSVKNIFIIEEDDEHPLLKLLGLQFKTAYEIKEEKSSLEEWQQEARRLELQGKHEQSEEIRRSILQWRQVPWTVLDRVNVENLKQEVLSNGQNVTKDQKIQLLEYALVYDDEALVMILADMGVKAARTPEKSQLVIRDKYFSDYTLRHSRRTLQSIEVYGVDFRNVFNQTPLMLAARHGAVELFNTLLIQGADPALLDNAGYSAFLYLLRQSVFEKMFAKKYLSLLYRRLMPSHISTEYQGVLRKIDAHLMEFFLLQMMFILLNRGAMAQRGFMYGGLSAQHFVNAFAEFSFDVLPDYRKKRAYISSVLSKNEVSRQDPYNRKLFLRVRTGYYIPHPNLAIRINDDWQNVCNLLGVKSFLEDYKQFEEDQKMMRKERLKQEVDE